MLNKNWKKPLLQFLYKLIKCFWLFHPKCHPAQTKSYCTWEKFTKVRKNSVENQCKKTTITQDKTSYKNNCWNPKKLLSSSPVFDSRWAHQKRRQYLASFVLFFIWFFFVWFDAGIIQIACCKPTWYCTQDCWKKVYQWKSKTFKKQSCANEIDNHCY